MPKNKKPKTAKQKNRELYSSSIKTGKSGTSPVPGYNSVFAKSVRVGRRIEWERYKKNPSFTNPQRLKTVPKKRK